MLKGAMKRQRTVNRYLYVKFMPILELERRDFWKKFGLQAVATMQATYLN
jgi:hypothetical protein